MKNIFYYLALVPFLIFLGSCTREDLLEETTMQMDSELSTTKDSSLVTSVTPDQALTIADLFLKKEPQIRSENLFASIEEINKDGKVLIYIVNYYNGGFALISGQTTYFPILAYSDTGRFIYDNENMHLGLEKWLEECKSVINGEYELDAETKNLVIALWNSYLNSEEEGNHSVMRATSSTSIAQYAFLQRKHELGALGYNSVSLDKASSLASSYGIDLDEYEYIANANHSPLKYTIFGFKEESREECKSPMLTTEWGQNYPYNGLSKANKADGAGCVTIAMAQIMKYFQHPATYNWSNMPDTTATQDTQELIRDIAQNLGISYSGSDNDATIIDAQNVFTSSLFQYDVQLKNHNTNDVVNSLADSKPVFMTGYDTCSSKGHAWVCEGYKRNHSTIKYFVEYLTGSEGNYSYTSPGTPCLNGLGTANRTGGYYFYMNWGWNGYENGWFVHNNVAISGINSCDYSEYRKNLYVSPK